MTGAPTPAGPDDPARPRAVLGTEATAAVGDQGWRYLLGALSGCVRTASAHRAAELAGQLVTAAGADAGDHLRLDLRDRTLIVQLQTAGRYTVTTRDLEIATAVAARVSDLGLALEPRIPSGRSTQAVELGIDALDIPAVRPFWLAVLGYVEDLPGDPDSAVADPLGQGPSVWFQQQDEPRPQRNRIHFDITVPHDEADARVAAALAAGGRLVSDAHAPAFRVLADPEGNEVCVCTWQGREH